MQTPAAIDYAKATSVADAVAKLESLGEEARPVAGGYSLLPMMKLRLAFPSALVDVHDLPDLQGVRVEGDELVVGAMTRHRDILDSAVLSEHYPIFREAERVIADPIVRARGTIGGSLCQADPASDLSAVGSALRGTAVCHAQRTGCGLCPCQAGFRLHQRQRSLDRLRHVVAGERSPRRLSQLGSLGKIEGVWPHDHRASTGRRFDKVLTAQASKAAAQQGHLRSGKVGRHPKYSAISPSESPSQMSAAAGASAQALRRDRLKPCSWHSWATASKRCGWRGTISH